jgi:phenylacetate-CoA ligase
MYWNSPYFLKNWMASLNSFKLDRQRYGSEFEQILEQIAEHDKWSPEQFREHQRKELCLLIQHAAVNVPCYRRIFQKTGVDPKSIKGPEDLKRLPILDKEVARANQTDMVDELLDASKLIINSTSGTTGMPLELYRDVWLNSAAFAYLDARWRNVAGMRRRINRSVTIGGHLVADPARTKPPFWLHNRRWDQLYMSSYHLSPRYLGYYVEELRRFKADYIEGYPSSVYAIAKYIVDNNIEPIEFKGCFTTAETLFDYHREAIKKAFACRTYNQYGCGEMAVFAAECSAGAMHLSPEFGIVEVVDDNDQPVPVGQTGHLICTGLINRVQPFIRYRIGDIGVLKDGGCSCRSSLPVLDRIEGRMGSMLITRDGRKIGAPGLTLLFHHVKGVAETQIVQEDYDLFRVRLVPAEGYGDTDGQKIVANLAERLGDVEIHLELTDKIERTKSGKFMAVVCNLPKNKQI